MLLFSDANGEENCSPPVHSGASSAISNNVSCNMEPAQVIHVIVEVAEKIRQQLILSEDRPKIGSSRKKKSVATWRKCMEGQGRGGEARLGRRGRGRGGEGRGGMEGQRERDGRI